MSVALQVFEVGEDLFGARYLGRRAANFNGIRPQVDSDLEAGFHQMQVFVTGTKEGLDIRADLDIFLQSDLGVTPWRSPGARGLSPEFLVSRDGIKLAARLVRRVGVQRVVRVRRVERSHRG